MDIFNICSFIFAHWPRGKTEAKHFSLCDIKAAIAARATLGVTFVSCWADAHPRTHRSRQAEVGTVPVVQRPPHRLWYDLKVSTGHQLQGALHSATFHGERGGLEGQKEKKVLHNSHTTICTRDHPSAWITRNRQKAHPDSMRSLLSLEQIAEIKTKRQETPSAPREPWLSHENLFFPSQVETTNRFLCQTREEADKRRIFFFGGFLLWMRWREMSRGKFAFAVYQKAGNTSGFLPHGFVRRAGRFLRRAELQWSRSRESSPALRLGATVRCLGEARKEAVNATCDPCCIIVSWWGRMGLRLCKH